MWPIVSAKRSTGTRNICVPPTVPKPTRISNRTIARSGKTVSEPHNNTQRELAARLNAKPIHQAIDFCGRVAVLASAVAMMLFQYPLGILDGCIRFGCQTHIDVRIAFLIVASKVDTPTLFI